MVKCDSCDQEFGHESSLEQHKQAKHSTGEKNNNSIKYGKSGGKLKYGLIVLVLLVIGGGVFAFTNNGGDATGQVISSKVFTEADVPRGPIHWHPELTIKINGQIQTIPADIGLSPSFHQPVHTHEVDGVIHLENNNPTESNMKLGFFFQIWAKKFNKDCIFSYCNDDKNSVKMFVNGQPNTDFENYFMKDKDKIEIEYG